MQPNIKFISARKNIMIYIYKDIYYVFLDDKMDRNVYYIDYSCTSAIFIFYGNIDCSDA